MGKGYIGGFNCTGFYFLEWVVNKWHFLYYYTIDTHFTIPEIGMSCNHVIVSMVAFLSL